MTDSRDERLEQLLRYYPGLCRYFVRMGFPKEDARDLAQEVFVRVYDHLDAYRGESKWNYLATTARRLALNTLRSNDAAKRSAPEFSLNDPSAEDAYDVPAESDPHEEFA